MLYIVYKTTNTTNGKYYIGKHCTEKLDDGYLGSGKILKCAIKKYGKDNFIREVLYTLTSEADMNAMEQQLVNDDLVNDPMCYNIVAGGWGGKIVLYPDHPLYDVVIARISDSRSGQRHWTNGDVDTISRECPGDGWVIGRSKVLNIKLSESTKSKMKQTRSNGACSWWNNGANNKRQVEMPGLGWKKGRLMSPFLYDKFCKKN